ncbi:MAG: AMP-binding protein [Muribaculaceae bacterium]|nr:AMP-binding protein [Muribaculaceae bacterium]
MDRKMTLQDQNAFLQTFLTGWYAEGGITVRTSGSTGTPKEIFLKKDQLERSARRTVKFFRLSKKSRLHSAVSFEFIGGKMMIARSLVCNGNLTFEVPSLTPRLPDVEEIDLASMVPAQMPHVLSHLEDFSKVRNILIGGSAVDDRLWDKLVASGLNIWESYAMTETASHVAMRRVAGPSGARPHFVALSGVKIFPGPDNCICIEDEDIFVQTNDIGIFYPDGSFEVKGRKDDVIITGGIKVLPQDIETIIRPHISDIFPSFYITSVPDELWTSRLIMKGVVAEEKRNLAPDEIKASVRERLEAIPSEILPSKKRPKEIVIIDAIPLTPSGKLIRI